MSANLNLPFIRSSGEPVRDHREIPVVHEYVNTPFGWLFPSEKLIKIQMASPSDASVIVEHAGEHYTPYYGFGMNAKEGITTGMRTDLLQGIAKYAQDAIRFNRWAFPQGWYGTAVCRPKILAVPKDTLYMGLPVADGFGYMTKSFAAALANRRRKITLNRSKGTYSFWQRIPRSAELESELMPYIQKRAGSLGDVVAMLECAGMDSKSHLVELDARMGMHPYIANALQRSVAEYLARASTSINVGARMRVAVPTIVDKAALPYRSIISRYPIDNYGSIQAVEPTDNLGEVERIKSMEVVQHSISSPEEHAKGCCGLVNDLGGADIVICEEDLKMGRLSGGEVAVTLLQHFSAGSAVGINMACYKDVQGIDGDGDQVEVIDATHLPVLYETVRSFPELPTPKIAKIKTPLTDNDRIDFLAHCFSNLVGMASISVANTLGWNDQQALASLLGSTMEKLHAHHNWLIKNGTDFKADVDRKPLETIVRSDNEKHAEYICPVPWPGWPNSWAFTHGLPKIAASVEVHEQVSKSGKKTFYRKFYDENGEQFTHDDEIKNIVSPEHDNFVAFVYQEMYPYLEQFDLDMSVPVSPLSVYYAWAKETSLDYKTWAYEFQNWYDDRIKSMNTTDPDEFSSFKTVVCGKINQFGLDRWLAANALWLVAHAKRGAYASASSVFLAFPDECERIIAEKPGLAAAELAPQPKTIITGCSHHIDNLEKWSGEIDVVDFTPPDKSGRVIVRKSIVAHISPDQRQAQSPYPLDHIGIVVKDAFQPEPGHYKARLTRRSQGSWELTLI